MTIRDIIKKEYLTDKKVLVQVRLQTCGFAGYFDWINNEYKDSPYDSEGWDDLLNCSINKYENLYGDKNPVKDEYDSFIVATYEI